MAEQSGTSEVTFARDLGLFDSTMIGVGAMIGAGIFVLTGIAAGEAGPASILAFALNGFVTLLTAFAYAELASAIPRAGGGYSFVRMAFPGALGFTAGWMLWFAYTVACSLYALGFAGYFWELFLKYAPGLAGVAFGLAGEHVAVLVVTFLVGAAFVRLNARGTEVTGLAENVLTVAKLVVLAVFILYGLKAVAGDTEAAASNFNPFLPMGAGGVLVAMGLTFIAFEGYDLIATVAEEIKEPEKNIPRATFISLAITVVMYLLILFVSLGAVHVDGQATWQFLGEFGETAIVRAAEDFMPAFGVAVIVFGGLLSTMSALNATVLAASRVVFSMGRDAWLPKPISKIDPKRRTPLIAVVTTGVVLLAMALTLPIETVGSAASLIFLLTFALVNLSVIVLRRKAPEIPRRYKVPLYPVVPVLGVVLNVFLAVYQFNFQPVAWLVTAGWVVLGLVIYFAYSQKQAVGETPQVFTPATREEVERPPYLVLVPVANPDNIPVLLDIACPIAKARGGTVMLLAVVSVPRQLPIHEGLRFVRHKDRLFSVGREHAAKFDTPVETEVIIAHHVYDGILSVARRFRPDLLVMGWKGYTNTRERIFGEVADQVIRHAPCDLMLLKLQPDGPFRRALLPTAGGPNAQLAAELLGVLAKANSMDVTVSYVVPPTPSQEERDLANVSIDNTLARFNEGRPAERLLIESSSTAAGIARASRDYDLVVLGAAKEPLFRRMLFGEIPEKVARYSPTSVLVVKRYEGRIRSLIKRILG